MERKKGKFIVIEGSDGVGKKTQADLLIKMLRRVGKRVAYYDFPQYERSFFGQMVGRYLNGEFGEADDVSPYLISLLYAGDRFEASEQIRHDLNLGKIVVSNRYTQSNMAFQTAKLKNDEEKEIFRQWLEELEFGVYHIPKPDLIVYLYLSYNVSQQLVDKKSSRNYTKMQRDIHEKNGDFLQRAEREYLYLAENHSEWQMVDCSDGLGGILPKEKITEKVFEVIKGGLAVPSHSNLSLFKVKEQE